MSEPSDIHETLHKMKSEIEALAAENLALQYILVSAASMIGSTIPNLRPAILGIFDAAALRAEDRSMAAGKGAGHIPIALKIIEQLRSAVADKDKPKHGV